MTFGWNLLTAFVSLAFVAVILDGMFTYRILKLGGGEANPLIAALMKVKSPVVALVVTRVVVLAIVAWQQHTAYFLGPVFALVAVHDYSVWRKLMLKKT